MTRQQRLVEKVIANFNFEMTHRMMSAVGWSFRGRPQTVRRLRAQARELFAHLLRDQEITATRSGGLRVRRYRNELDVEIFVLEFIGEWTDSEGY